MASLQEIMIFGDGVLPIELLQMICYKLDGNDLLNVAVLNSRCAMFVAGLRDSWLEHTRMNCMSCGYDALVRDLISKGMGRFYTELLPSWHAIIGGFYVLSYLITPMVMMRMMYHHSLSRWIDVYIPIGS